MEEAKQREAAKSLPAPSKSNAPPSRSPTKPKDMPKNSGDSPLEPFIVRTPTKIPNNPEPTASVLKVEPNVSIEQQNQEPLEGLGNLSESDRAKLERKRRQQQKKEEFLQQLKRHKSDDNADAAGPANRTDSSSPPPVPEGIFNKFSAFLTDNCILILFFADDTETWMREIDQETFRLVSESAWEEDGTTINPQTTLNNYNRSVSSASTSSTTSNASYRPPPAQPLNYNVSKNGPVYKM